MNVFTGALFTIAIVFGWLLFFWWLVIMFLGADVRRELRKMNAVLPEYQKRYILLSAVVNLVSVVLTVGYFIEAVHNFYLYHQLLLVVVSFVAAGWAACINDSLHHQLLHHIHCLDGAKKVMADKLDESTVDNSLDEQKTE